MDTDSLSFGISCSLIQPSKAKGKTKRKEKGRMGELLASILEELEDNRITEQDYDRIRETLRSISKEPKEIPDPLERYYCSF